MDAEGKGAQQRAIGRLEAAAVTVQASVARGCVGRERASKAWERREMVRLNVRLNWAASLLQTRWVKGGAPIKGVSCVRHGITLLGVRRVERMGNRLFFYDLNLLHTENMRWCDAVGSRFRAFSAQTRAAKMAVKRFYRCLDDLTGAEYYFDPKTGTVT